VKVQHDVHTAPHCLADSLHARRRLLDDAVVVHDMDFLERAELQSRIALRDDLFRVAGPLRRRAATQMAIDADTVADGPAEQLPDGTAQRLAEDAPQRDL